MSTGLNVVDAEIDAVDRKLSLFRKIRLLVMIMRFTVACILGVGAIVLAYSSKDGWWWFLVCSFVLGVISWSSSEPEGCWVSVEGKREFDPALNEAD